METVCFVCKVYCQSAPLKKKHVLLLMLSPAHKYILICSVILTTWWIRAINETVTTIRPRLYVNWKCTVCNPAYSWLLKFSKTTWLKERNYMLNKSLLLKQPIQINLHFLNNPECTITLLFVKIEDE